jgi:hypothetical protein
VRERAEREDVRVQEEHLGVLRESEDVQLGEHLVQVWPACVQKQKSVCGVVYAG